MYSGIYFINYIMNKNIGKSVGCKLKIGILVGKTNLVF